LAEPTRSGPPEEKVRGDDREGSEVARAEDEGEAIFAIETLMAVDGGGTEPTFDLDSPYLVTAVMTYHWNDGTGAVPGEIGLRAGDGTEYGPWQAVGAEGQGGVPDAYWWVYPQQQLPAGTYTVVDSDPATWSQNGETDGRGIVLVKGVRD
jgi:hypothetical protein